LPNDVEARLRGVAALADLNPARRLDAKTDMCPEAVERRLRKVSALRRLCLRVATSEPVRPTPRIDGS
jgi:hypothetical protein